MNTNDTNTLSVTAPSSIAPAAFRGVNKLRLLLKREFWEHKGGFFWAPIWAGGISLVLTLLGMIVGSNLARKAISSGRSTVDGNVNINGLDMSMLSSKLDATDLQGLGHGLDIGMFSASIWPLLAIGFVVFFYCLGSLYDERQDRSVLFWKSLPVSDRDTVISKVISAIVIAPAIAIITSIITMFVFLIMLSGFVLLHNGNPMTLVWGPGSPILVATSILATLPIYALWSLPTVGWLMLCSVWAKSKPFLWAILLPMFAWIIVASTSLMNVFSLDAGWFGRHVVARSLISVFPGTWFMNSASSGNLVNQLKEGDGVGSAFQVGPAWSMLGTSELWVGVLVGSAMIYIAIRLRRWRDDN